MIIYSDESISENQRFHVITGISGKKEILKNINQNIEDILIKHGLEEFKYNKMSNLKKFDAFKKVIDLVIFQLLSKQIRVDSIVRDRLDARHQINGIDHDRNFERMYYFLLRIIVKKYNNPQKTWNCCVDEKGGCRWGEIEKYIKLTKTLKYPDQIKKGLFEKIENITGKEKIEMVIQEGLSHKTPLIQVADLLAGFIGFSRKNHEQYGDIGLSFYHRWKTKGDYISAKNSLFGVDDSLLLYEKLTSIEGSISNNDRKKYYVKEYLVNQFKKSKLGLSIATNKYISSNYGEQGFYILHYEPQSIYDKAPIK